VEKLQELQEKLYSKQDVLKGVFDEAKLNDGTYDFLKSSAFKTYSTTQQCLDQITALEKELEEIHVEVKTLETIKHQEDRVLTMIHERSQIEDPHLHPDATDTRQPRMYQKSLGDLMAQDWPSPDRLSRAGVWLEKEYRNFDIKTLMTTAAGWAPQAIRIPRINEFAATPIQVTDLFPIGNTTQAAVVYMSETTMTNAAAEVGEGLIFAESALAFTEVTVTVRKIATYLPVTDEQLADVAQVQALIDGRLRYFASQRLDSQLIVGNGVGVNMLGLINTPGIQTQAKGADPTPDAIYKAMVKVRVTGRATPSGVLVNPNDWADVRLLRTADGMYIWGNPSEAGPMRIWGVPVAETDVITENTGLVGDFANHSMLFMRQGVEVLAGFINDDFIKGRQAIRVTMRGVLVCFRPSAFSTITGI
jgi:HK97 family phage major capsid protein